MAVKPVKLRIGTRGSPLALAQTEIVRAELKRVRPDVETEVVIIKTSGDWTPAQGERPLDRGQGGKAMFAKELEEALLGDKIAAAVHSMKDVESVLPEGLIIGAVLPREDARDAIILKNKNGAIQSLQDLPQESVIGTCSVRRTGMLLAVRPDLKIETLRGNVGTRLEKLQAGKMGGIVLATAGLNRLQLAKEISFILPVGQMLPSAAQGAIGIEFKENNKFLLAIFSQLNCPMTMTRIICERTVLQTLGGSCNTPVGVHAIIEDDRLHVEARLVSVDGKQTYQSVGNNVVKIDGLKAGKNSQPTDWYVDMNSGNYKEALMIAETLGRTVGAQLKKQVPKELL